MICVQQTGNRADPAAAAGRVHLATMAADGAVSHAEVGGLSPGGGFGWFRFPDRTWDELEGLPQPLRNAAHRAI
jgi:hypothetical protein